MVSLSAVQSSNSRIASSLPPRLVGVFVGATAGIGEATFKQFAKHVPQPRAYLIGRSQGAADRIVAECKTLNPRGEYIFIKADVSLIRAVDAVCEEIKAKESAINVLFCTQGTLDSQTETSEGLRLIAALGYYSRFRFIFNLLPLIKRATGVCRVVVVFGGGFEGKVNLDNLQGRGLSMFSYRDQVSSLLTLSLEAVARQAPSVGFVHDCPGVVNTPGLNSFPGIMGSVSRVVIRLLGTTFCIPNVESGERHLFLATSAMYAPAEKVANGDGDGGGSGVPFVAAGGDRRDETAARGTNGKNGSGVYSILAEGQSSGPKVEKVLVGLRDAGMVDKVWQRTEGELEQIAG